MPDAQPLPGGPPTSGEEPLRTPTWAPEALLDLLHRSGAHGLRSVVFRANRRTLWSLTRRGSVLNLHEAYARASEDLLARFAVLIREAPRRSPAYYTARRALMDWSGVREALRKSTWKAPPCAASTLQRVYLQRLYRFLNATRFDGRLPSVVPIRLSSRFTRRLGQMVPGLDEGRRVVREIALSVDLMLPANDALLLDTMLHEMAHVAHYVEEGGLDHGPRWRWWARRAGCEARACRQGPVRRRRRTAESVSRVPPLPSGWRERATASDADWAATQARARIRTAASTTASAVTPNAR